jgi:putative ABC transport system substrate-binding protein
MTMIKKIYLIVSALFILSCNSVEKKSQSVPRIGFLDFVEDATLAKARQGFTDALEKAGFSEKNKSLTFIYRNAQGDIPTLGQACDYFISEKVDLIASNTTLSTITAVQRSREIPVCMMVSPRPDLAGLTDKSGKAPANLFGVYETHEYIDTAIAIIHEVYSKASKICAIYSQSEPQSVAAFEQIEKQCKKLGMKLSGLPVNNSSETQLVVASLLKNKPDAFFALPDNSVFASFETIVKSCDEARVPVFTSEAGLVQRGAVAAYGADMYQWGYQSGEMAASYFGGNKNQKPEIVRVRKRVYNPIAASKFNLKFGSSFEILK